MNKLGYSSNLFSISDIAARASKMILIEYLTALSDVKVIPPTLQGQLSQPCNTKEKDLPYLMISLFPSQQSLSLWKTRLQLVDSGNTKLRLVAGFGFKGESLHPTTAKFFGEERIYVTFEEPSIRIYNLAKLDFLQDFTESERRYEFDLTFEGSTLNIRSSYSDKVSIINLNSPLKETRSWKITMVGENCIMCYEKHSNLIVLLNTTKKQGALYKALQFERESKDIPVIECWFPSHVNEGNKLSIYFIDNIYTIYGLEVEVDRKDSAECEKVACKKIYQPSYPILNNSTKTFEFFKWVKEEPSNKKLQPGVDACIVLVPSKFIIIDLKTGEVKDIALPPKIMPRGWTIVDNVLAYEHNGLIYLSSLYLNSEEFGVSIKGLSLYSSSPNIMQVHFLTFKGVLAIVWESGSNLNVEFLHAYAFDPKLFPASLSKEKIKGHECRDCCETSMDLFTLFGGEPALAEKKMYTIKNSIMLRFSLSKFDTENSFTHYEHAEARNSLILYQRNNAIFFVDIFNKCRQEPRWKGPKDSQNNIDDKSAKLQLVNHKELIPNQNKPVGIVKPKEIPQSQPTKTSLKKELKDVSKAEKTAKIKELTTKEDAVEESKDAHGHQDKAVALNLQKISKAQKVQERNEKKKKNDKSMRAEILNKKSF